MATYKFTSFGSRPMTLYLLVDGRREKIKITPPVFYGNYEKAYYITNDSKIAEALKKHPSFGALFYLESEVDDTPKVAEVVVKPEDLLVDPVNVIFEESVTSKAKAVAYIQGMYDESFSNTTSIEEMKKEAARRWNIIFVNWK